MAERNPIWRSGPWASCLLFLLLAVVIDRALGLTLTRGLSRVKTGQSIGLTNAALDHLDADVLVFGTSRVRHHVIPEVMEQAIGCDVYNAGLNGQGVLYQRALEALVLERETKARLFLLIVEPGSLQHGHEERVTNMTVFYGEDPVVDEIVREVTPHARIKLLSWAYRFNGIAVPIAANRLFRRGSQRTKGFWPLHGALGPPGGPPWEVNWISSSTEHPVRPHLLERTREFIEAARAHGVEVVLFSGPRLERPFGEIVAQAAIDALAAELKVPLLKIDEERYPVFLDANLFRDKAHLNGRGAEIYSLLLTERLVELNLAALDCGEPSPAAIAGPDR